MSEAPKKKASPGWYADPSLPNTKRYWSGEGWTDQRFVQRPVALSKPEPLRWTERPEGLIWGSLLLAVGLGFFDGILFFVNRQVGVIGFFVVVYFTSALFLIGLIAKGVELGIRAARHRQDLDF